MRFIVFRVQLYPTQWIVPKNRFFQFFFILNFIGSFFGSLKMLFLEYPRAIHGFFLLKRIRHTKYIPYSFFSILVLVGWGLNLDKQKKLWEIFFGGGVEVGNLIGYFLLWSTRDMTIAGKYIFWFSIRKEHKNVQIKI